MKPTDPAVSAALDTLFAAHPKGFTVDAAGLLTVSERVRPTTLADLLTLKAEPRLVALDLGNSRVEIPVFVLSEEMTTAFERQVPTPIPPPKFKMEGGKQVPDGYDRDNAAFREAVELNYALRRALTLRAAVPLLAVQGETPEQMRDWLLAQKFPVHFLDSLYAAAKNMSETPERAVFI